METKSATLSHRDKLSLKRHVVMLSERQREQLPPGITKGEFEELFWTEHLWNTALKIMRTEAPEALKKQRFIKSQAEGVRFRAQLHGYQSMLVPDDDSELVRTDLPAYANLMNYLKKANRLARREYFVKLLSDYVIENCASTGQLFRCWPELVQLEMSDDFIRDKMKGLRSSRSPFPDWFTGQHRKALMAVSNELAMGLLLETHTHDEGDMQFMIFPDTQNIAVQWIYGEKDD